MEFHATAAEVIEHRYQIAQAAAQPVELPHDKRVAVFELLQTAEGAGRFVVAPDNPSSLKTVLHPAFFSAANCKAGFWSLCFQGSRRWFKTYPFRDMRVFKEQGKLNYTCFIPENCGQGFVW
jgi:hypothetical protein